MSHREGSSSQIEAVPPAQLLEQKPRALKVAAVAAATALAACGGGGGGGGGAGIALPVPNATPTSTDPSPTAGVPVPGSPIVAGAATTIYTAPATDKDAARFLSQASPGASKSEITALRGMSYSTWIDEQFALPSNQSHYDWLAAKGYATTGARTGQIAGLDNTLWRKFMSSPDALRQRMVLALTEIFVVSIDGLNVSYPQFAVGRFVDVIEAEAFGNYRTLLENVSRCAAMGTYLTYAGNQLANPGTGGQPDENYARELMQIFCIGLYQLNNDGSHVLVNGEPVETFGQADVSGLARVFTGWFPDDTDGRETPKVVQLPMKVLPENFEAGKKQFLGTTIAPSAQSAEECLANLRAALDTLFKHPNMPPFVGRQLIQRLVTSNPSPAYINRVANAFINNGNGVRGDMKAVIRQILLDDEARNPQIASTIAFGKLREPFMRLLNWARGFNVTSPSGNWNIGDLSDPATALGQSPLHAPSVFNFFRPGFIPATSELARYGLNGPEFQITNESSVSGYVNFMQRAISGQGVADLRADYGALLALAADSTALLDEVNLVLAAGEISAETLAMLKGAIDTISPATATGKLNRVYAALTLVLASPEYIVQK